MRRVIDLSTGEETTLPSLPPVEPSPEQVIATEVNVQKAYLASTDFKMTVDYHASLTAVQKTALKNSRATARAYVQENDIDALV